MSLYVNIHVYVYVYASMHVCIWVCVYTWARGYFNYNREEPLWRDDI